MACRYGWWTADAGEFWVSEHRVSAYGAGGTSTDHQGRRYTKVDCTTTKPF